MRLYAGAWVVPLLCLGACSSAPVNLESSYKPPSPRHDVQYEGTQARRAAVIPVAVHCRVFLETEQDLRADKADMGNIAWAPVRARDMLKWVDSGIVTLAAEGYRIDKTAAADDAVTMDVDLLKAYMISMSTSKSANLVVRISYKRPDGAQLATQVYRGVDTSVNWADGEGETNTAFQRATKQVLDQVSADLDGYCRASTATASTG